MVAASNSPEPPQKCAEIVESETDIR